MTESEYASVRRKASAQSKSVSTYVRELALGHRLKTDYSFGEINRVRNAGQRFNRFVHGLHIDPTIIIGARRPGQRHYDDVMKELYILEQVLQGVERKTWRLSIEQVRRGDGKRIGWGKVRCTPREHDLIKARAARAWMTQAAFIRAIALNRPIGRATFYDMIDQLARIENNLHQLMGLRHWDYVAGQRIHLLTYDIDRRIRELSSGRKRKEPDT